MLVTIPPSESVDKSHVLCPTLRGGPRNKGACHRWRAKVGKKERGTLRAVPRFGEGRAESHVLGRVRSLQLAPDSAGAGMMADVAKRERGGIAREVTIPPRCHGLHFVNAPLWRVHIRHNYAAPSALSTKRVRIAGGSRQMAGRRLL